MDMVATKLVIAESQIKAPLTTGPPEMGRQLTIDEVFAEMI